MDTTNVCDFFLTWSPLLADACNPTRFLGRIQGHYTVFPRYSTRFLASLVIGGFPRYMRCFSFFALFARELLELFVNLRD